MTDIIIKNLKNHSDDKQFMFSLSCASCGKRWYSTPVKFSKAGQTPANGAKEIVWQALYQKEAKQAMLKAVEEAKQYFNYCPVCRCLVCDNCFIICDEIDMCIDCAKELGETGEPVAYDITAN